MSIPSDYLNQIVTGDARELAKRIPDESIDLILCDPVFQNHDDYAWLARLGARVLKEGGNLVAETGHEHLPSNIAAMTTYLDWVWLLTEKNVGGASRMWNKRIMAMYSPYLWFSKGLRSGRWIFDSHNGSADKSQHEWGDGSRFFELIVDRLTEPGATVFDPFTGGGTVPAVCKMLGRNYVAFEIDVATAEGARERVAHTQMPLFVEQSQQLELT